MKKTLLYASIVSLLTAAVQAQNENVTWQAPTTITNASDVSTQGTFFGSWAPYDGSANSLPVNGVVFEGNASLTGFTTGGGFNSGYNSYANPNTSNANYNALLQYATYDGSGNGSGDTITWSDTPGHTYLIQIWANDGRGNDRSETFTGGTNTSASLVFGNFPGQYIIGTYVADTSGSETITLSGANSNNGDYPQVNLLQVRDITTTTVTNYQSAVLNDNPLAFYALNPAADPSGTSPDLTGNGNNGTASNITPATGPSPYITNAANFVAANYSYDDLSEGANAALLNYSGPITMEAWVQPSSSSESLADIVAKGYDSGSYNEIVMRANGGNYYGSSGSVGESGGKQNTDWSYVVLSSDGTHCSLYINGGLVSQSSDPNGAVNFVDDWVIGDGSSGGNSRFFDGNISEVAIYNYGLTAAQIQSHYYYGMAGTNNLNYAAPIITTQPQPQAAYAGDTVTFSDAVLSELPTTNQWYSNSIPIIGQTNASLTLTDVQAANVASYSVVVGNNNGTASSASASLTLLTPGNSLQWSANNNNGTWDTDNSANWINLANSQQTVFNTNDQVLFDDTAGVPTSVTVSGTVAPYIVTVNSSINNFSIASGAFSGPGSLIKEGSSTLTLDTTGLTGPVTINGGAIYAGNNSLDSVASITITNSSTLDMAGAGFTAYTPITVSGTGLNGEGAIYNSYGDYPSEALDITMTGDTTFGGSARWDLAGGSQINGAHNLTVDWSADSQNGYYGQWNTLTIGASVPGIILTNALSGNSVTNSFGMSYMDTCCQNPGTMFTVSSNCLMLFYSGGFNGSIHFLNGSVAYIYNPNVTFNGSNLIFENNSSIQTYYNSGVNNMNGAVTFNGVAHFVLGDHSMVYSNVLSGIGGFVLDYYNNEMVLSASNTYTGPTIIGSSNNNPEIALTGNGSISQSSLIFFGGSDPTVAHVDVSGRSDQTLTLANGQTLAGIGGINGSLVVSPGATISPAGTNTTIGITTGANSTGTLAAANNVTLNGVTIIKLNGSGINDMVQAGANITFGGTLNLTNISGSPLAAGNSFQIFSAAGYSGSFASITPATPGPGLTWNTNSLAVNGTVTVVSPALPKITSIALSGTTLTIAATDGPMNAAYVLLESTNVALPLSQWTPVFTNAFDANGDINLSTNVINPNNRVEFYILQTQ